jgi:hypothetical protein
MSKIKKTVILYKGTPVTGTAYTPNNTPLPVEEIKARAEKYLIKGKYNPLKSEERKVEIQKNSRSRETQPTRILKDMMHLIWASCKQAQYERGEYTPAFM